MALTRDSRKRSWHARSRRAVPARRSHRGAERHTSPADAATGKAMLRDLINRNESGFEAWLPR